MFYHNFSSTGWSYRGKLVDKVMFERNYRLIQFGENVPELDQLFGFDGMALARREVIETKGLAARQL